MKVVTATTVWNDAVGKRMSIVYSEIDDATGRIITDNKRIDRVVTGSAQKTAVEAVEEIAQAFVDAFE